MSISFYTCLSLGPHRVLRELSAQTSLPEVLILQPPHDRHCHVNSRCLTDLKHWILAPINLSQLNDGSVIVGRRAIQKKNFLTSSARRQGTDSCRMCCWHLLLHMPFQEDGCSFPSCSHQEQLLVEAFPLTFHHRSESCFETENILVQSNIHRKSH